VCFLAVLLQYGVRSAHSAGNGCAKPVLGEKPLQQQEDAKEAFQ
jgi:hypothetical protein